VADGVAGGAAKLFAKAVAMTAGAVATDRLVVWAARRTADGMTAGADTGVAIPMLTPGARRYRGIGRGAACCSCVVWSKCRTGDRDGSQPEQGREQGPAIATCREPAGERVESSIIHVETPFWCWKRSEDRRQAGRILPSFERNVLGASGCPAMSGAAAGPVSSCG
jgi:hypothetical protein